MASRYLLGFDVGSSSVKASLTDVDNGEIVASAFYPDHEAPIMAVKTGWAEQDPQMWWDNAKLALKKIMAESGAKVKISLLLVSRTRCMAWFVLIRISKFCVLVSSGATLVPYLTARRLFMI